MLRGRIESLPRVAAGNPDGGQWTTGDGGSESSSDAFDAARDGLGRPRRYAALETGTLTDQTPATPAISPTNSPGDVVAQYLQDLRRRLANLVPPQMRAYHVIGADQIPADSPRRPVQFSDSSGRPILDDQSRPMLRPDDLPPERYAQEGAASHLAEYVYLFKQAVQDQLNEPSEENEQALAGLTAKISQELAPFVHGGSLDAERFDYNYVRDYRRYTSVATGVFMAAAGISRDDYLAIADAYASALSTFSPNETRDPVYSHLAKQDVDDNLRGYDLYEAGRIRQSR
jgi:hypothetical protein